MFMYYLASRSIAFRFVYKVKVDTLSINLYDTPPRPLIIFNIINKYNKFAAGNGLVSHVNNIKFYL